MCVQVIIILKLSELLRLACLFNLNICCIFIPVFFVYTKKNKKKNRYKYPEVYSALIVWHDKWTDL